MKKHHIISFYLIAIFILCFIALSVLGSTGKVGKRVRYDHSEKRLISDGKTGVTILKGDVKLNKIDPETGAKGDYIYADQVTIYKNTETEELTRIEAMGNVKMKEGDMLVTCARAVMKYEPEEVIEMEGSPAIVDDKENRIEAPLIKYYRKDDRLEAEATEGYVTGNITIEEKTTQEENK